MSMDNRPRAFSLVELLVVLGIVGLLIGILLPALMATQARARDLKCVATLRDIGVAAALHASDHRGYLPAAGWHWKPSGGTVDPQGVGDERRTRYVYYTDAGVERPVPITVALGQYLGIKPNLQNRETLEDLLDTEALRKRFHCPSQEAGLKGLSQKEDGGGWTAPPEWSSYVFNEALLGKRDRPVDSPVGKVTKVKRASIVMLAMDGRPRSAEDNWLMVFDFGNDDTLDDYARKIQETNLGKDTLDYLRHRGRINVLFVDHHVESLPMTPAGLQSVGISRGIYD